MESSETTAPIEQVASITQTQPTKLFSKLRDHFGEAIVLGQSEDTGAKDGFILIAGQHVREVAFFCRDQMDLRFDFCQSLTGMDSGTHMTCVYHLFSYVHRHTLILKVHTSREHPVLPSSVLVWPVCNWYEREIYDLFGVTFEGHPDLRRLLLPEDWPGHPMLKDWKEPAAYNGMPTTRENPLDLLSSQPAAD